MGLRREAARPGAGTLTVVQHSVWGRKRDPAIDAVVLNLRHRSTRRIHHLRDSRYLVRFWALVRDTDYRPTGKIGMTKVGALLRV